MSNEQLINIISLHSNIFSKLFNIKEILLICELNKNFNNLIKTDKNILNMIKRFIKHYEKFVINNDINISYNFNNNNSNISFYISSVKYSYSFMRVFKLKNKNDCVMLSINNEPFELKKFYYILIKHYNIYKSLKLKELIKYLDLIKNEYNTKRIIILS